eukprot:TRINITY_DN5105_c0_g1_i6.p2 TRINITY_DN5105_c0_g1~~TRINITY_DN5105_c0_g1_i6.p2  ORF type:complete len:212 (+),score=12.43 TRINITY_DN5105_c0_g1_i6:260-895(+)
MGTGDYMRSPSECTPVVSGQTRAACSWPTTTSGCEVYRRAVRGRGGPRDRAAISPAALPPQWCWGCCAAVSPAAHPSPRTALQQSAPPPFPRRAYISVRRTRTSGSAGGTRRTSTPSITAPALCPSRHKPRRPSPAAHSYSLSLSPPFLTIAKLMNAGQVLRSEQALVNGCFPRDPDGTLIIAAPPKIFTRSDVLKMAGAAKRKAEAKAKL